MNDGGLAETQLSQRTATWAVSNGQLQVFFDDNGTVVTIDRIVDTGDTSMALVQFDSPDYYYAELSMLVQQTNPAPDDISPFLNVMLHSGFFITSDDPGYARRFPDGRILDTFGFRLNDDFSSERIFISSSAYFVGDTEVVEGDIWRQSGTWEQNGSRIVSSTCFYGNDVDGTFVCDRRQVRTWDLVKATGSRLYVIETLTYEYDTDGDGVMESVAYRISRPNFYEIDTAYDLNDPDGDGYINDVDRFPTDPNEWVDSDGNGIGDNSDPGREDTDGDGILDVNDSFPLDASETLDTDSDGIGNNADSDDDGDGYSDTYELETGTDPLDASDFKPPYDDLNGFVYHWSQHSLLVGAEITRTSTTQAQVLTNNQGQYSFDETAEGSYDLLASQSVSQADTNRTITSADALAALKIAVGLNPNSDPDGDGPLEALAVSPYQLIAADMNQDGRVTSADALAILKVAVGLSDALLPSWKLIEDSQALWTTHNDKSKVFNASQAYALSYPDQTQANFAAVLLGDVNASWKPADGAETLSHDHFSAYAKATSAPLALWGIRDSDQDGLSDEQEDALGTSPFDTDTDADGVNDIDDAYPLDATWTEFCWSALRRRCCANRVAA